MLEGEGTRSFPVGFCLAAAFLVTFFACPKAGKAQRQNGFDLAKATIPTSAILRGGPPRDGIPALDSPKFVSAGEALYLEDEDIVIGIGEGDHARAYPLRILVWHELVNDEIGGRPVLISYCPLCGTAMVFDRRIEGKALRFGVSGLLYQSDVLMYDRESESLWTQLGMRAVSGKMAGKELVWLSSERTTWSDWRARNPGGRVLSVETGHRRDYGRMPYEGYEDTERTVFPVKVTRRELGNKEWVAGLRWRGRPVAFVLEGIGELRQKTFFLQGAKLRISHERKTGRFKAWDEESGEAVPVVMAYWFAWQAFYPETELIGD